MNVDLLVNNAISIGEDDRSRDGYECWRVHGWGRQLNVPNQARQGVWDGPKLAEH